MLVLVSAAVALLGGSAGCGGGSSADDNGIFGAAGTAGASGAGSEAGAGGDSTDDGGFEAAGGSAAGGGDASSGDGDASLTDGVADVSSEAAADANDGSSLPIDCPSGRGPAMVRASFPAYKGIPDFCIDSTKVTQAQYKEFLDANPTPPSQPPYCASNTDLQPGTTAFNQVCYGSYDPAAHPNWPVTCVDWCDAAAYCAWAGKRLCGAIGGGHIALPYQAKTSGLDDPHLNEWFAACTDGSAAATKAYPYTGLFTEECSPWYYYAAQHPSDPLTFGDVGVNLTCAGGIPGVWDITSLFPEWTDACTDFAGSGDRCLTRPGLSNSYTYSSSTMDGWACAIGPVGTLPSPMWLRTDDAGAIRCCADVAPLPGG